MNSVSVPANRQAFSIGEFCQRNGISLHLYHKLRLQGRGPRVMALGRAIRISIEAEQAWRHEREVPALGMAPPSWMVGRYLCGRQEKIGLSLADLPAIPSGLALFGRTPNDVRSKKTSNAGSRPGMGE